MIKTFPHVRPLVTRLTRRYERRALTKRNLPYYVWRFIGNGIRTFRKLTTPLNHPDVPAIASELLQEGIVVGSAGQFLSEEGRRGLAEAAAQVVEHSRSSEVQAIVAGARAQDRGKKDFLVSLVRAQGHMPPTSPLLTTALDPKLIEIVSSYFGFWPCLHSIAAWLNYSTDSPAETSQLWHRDPEDLKIIKVFIYLEDVGEENGPFTYVPRTHPFGSRAERALTYNQKRVDEKRMRRSFPPNRWRVCTGPAHTMILADTVGFHRGGKPSSGTRLLITFTYTSATQFIDHPLGVKALPQWLSSPIQRYAVAPVVLDDERPIERLQPDDA